MAIKYILNGNIFQSTAQVLANPVNAQGVMGAGLAKAFKQRFPEIVAPYEEACNSGTLKPGELMMVRTRNPRQHVLLFPTKDHWENPSRIEWIDRGFEYLIGEIQGWRSEYGITSMAIPGLGCGRGKLEWKEVQRSIEYYARQPELRDLLIEVYVPYGERIHSFASPQVVALPPVAPQTPGREGPLVYVYGYSRQAREIDKAMKQHGKVLLIDTREKAWSDMPGFKQEELEQRYGKRYQWEGAYLGNLNRKAPHLGVKLKKEEQGLQRLCNAIRNGFTLVLMCGCTHEGCHRFYIARKLAEKWTQEYASRYGHMTIQTSATSATLILQ